MEEIRTGSEQLLSKILNTTSACIFWKDKERRFVGVNQAFLDYYGFSSAEELIGKTDEDIGWHSDPDPYKSDEWQVLEKGESTYRVHGKCMARGSERDIVASKSPIYEDGRIVGLVGTFEDVTNEYRQSGEIRKLTQTLNAIPCGICISRISYGKGICVSANKYMADMIGLEPSDFAGKSMEELTDESAHPHDRERLKADAAKPFTSGQNMDGVYRFLNRKTGVYSWIRVKGRRERLVNDEEFVYYTFTDENDLKNYERQEEALRKLYAASVEAAKLVVWEYDISTRIVTFASEGYTARRLKDLGLESVYRDVPDSIFHFIPDESKAEVKRLFSDVLSGKPFTEADILFTAFADREPLYLHITFTTETDSDGEPKKAYGTSQNVTREKNADLQYEQELKYLYADRQRELIAKGHHDLTANRVLDYYIGWQHALDVTGMSYDGAYGKLLDTIMYEEDRENYLDLYSRTNLIERFYNGKTYFSMEYCRIGGQHSVTWVFMEIRTFKNPVTGNIECFIYSYDVTGKYIRKELSNSLTLIGYEKVGFLSIPKHKVTYYGLSAETNDWEITEDLPDYEEDLIRKIRETIPADEQEEAIRAIRMETVKEALEKDSNYVYAYNTQSAEGTMRRKHIRYRYLNRDRNVVFISVQDITGQYREEQNQIARLKEAMRRGDEANQAKSDFLSRMSHDIRTPMNVIIGMTYLAKQEPNPVKTQDYLDKITASSKFLLGLVNDVLDMSKIESNKIELHPEPYYMDQFLDYLNSIIRPLCEGKNQKLIMDVKAVEGVAPLIDVLRINQIFFNLFSNAVKYTPEGGTIMYRLREYIDENDRLVLDGDVIDNGIGMTKELQKVIFDPFTQGERSDTQETRGTGLGLSIVKRLIGLMGGTVSVESEPGKGSDFHLRAEFDYITDSAHREKQEEGAASSGSVSGDNDGTAEDSLTEKHILLCEDHPLNQEIVKTILENKKMIVSVAENGETGVRMFSCSGTGYYNAVLMDIRMPVMDGYEATRRIRALPRPDAKTVPIIAMTADAFSDDVQKCLDAGMNEHLAKPIDPDKMVQVLNRNLKREPQKS